MVGETFDEKEVLDVVKGMVRDKASSPDGVSMAFFQDCWDIVREDVVKVFFFFLFHAYMKLKKSLNATFTALVPKKMEGC